MDLLIRLYIEKSAKNIVRKRNFADFFDFLNLLFIDERPILILTLFDTFWETLNSAHHLFGIFVTILALNMQVCI